MDDIMLKDSVTEEKLDTVPIQDDSVVEEPEASIDMDANGKTMEDEYKEELDFLDEQITSNMKERRRLMITCGVIFALCVVCFVARLLAWG